VKQTCEREKINVETCVIILFLPLGIFSGVSTQNETTRIESSLTRKRLNYIKRFSEHGWGHISRGLGRFDQC
jgi:hypothetical protein